MAANCQILAWLLSIKIIILSDIPIISRIRKIMPDNNIAGHYFVQDNSIVRYCETREILSRSAYFRINLHKIT